MATTQEFSTYDIQDLLYDQERNGVLNDALNQVVRPGDFVVDANAGAGVGALFALRAGAERVLAIEPNEEYASVVAPETIKRNKGSDGIIVVHGDPLGATPSPFDVLIADLPGAGFLGTRQLQIIEHLGQFLRPDGRIVPYGSRHSVELLQAEKTFYGMDLAGKNRWATRPKDRTLTSSAVYLDVVHGQGQSLDINKQVTVRGIGTAVANALRISCETAFAPDQVMQEPSGAWYGPQIIFLDKPVRVRKNEHYQVSLAYTAGAAATQTSIQVDF